MLQNEKEKIPKIQLSKNTLKNVVRKYQFY